MGQTIRAVVCVIASLLISAGPATSQPEKPTLRLRLVLPEREAASPVDLHLVFENVSDKPFTIMDEWNSFGHYNAKLEFTYPDGRHVTTIKSREIWSRNFPTATTVAPGELLIRDIFFDPKVWQNLPDIQQQTKLQVKVLFEQAFEYNLPQDQKLSDGLWKGKTESNVVLIDYPPKP